jgi:hypothetical protein
MNGIKMIAMITIRNVMAMMIATAVMMTYMTIGLKEMHTSMIIWIIVIIIRN